MTTENVETTSDAPLSISEAVKLFSASETPQASDEEQAQDEPAQEDETAEELPADEVGEEEGEPVDDQEQADDDEAEDDGEGEPESEQGRFVNHDARVKLADGSFTTVADLVAGSLRRDDYTRKTQETAAEQQAATAEREHLSQLRKSNEEIRAYTIAVLEKFMPQPPDDALYSTDLVKAMEMERTYKARKEELDFLKAQRDWDQQQEAQTKSEEARKLANSEWVKLAAHPDMPELKDEGRGKALLSGILAYGQKQGYSEQELRGALAFDHRQAVILRKAMAFDALQEARKQKVPAKIEGRPPVQKSSKRLNANGMAHREAKTAMGDLTKSGSIKDGVRAYLAMQKANRS